MSLLGRGWKLTAVSTLLAVATLSAEDLGEGGYRLAETERDPAVETALLDLFPDYTLKAVEIEGQTARYLYNRVDLDDDGRDEAVVYLLGTHFCGTGGCSLVILRPTENGLAVVNNFPASEVPLVVKRHASNGWRDLVRLTAGGGAEPAYHLLQFDGERYVAAGTVVDNLALEGTALLADDVHFGLGNPLEPRP
jgi:hypothetical protein